MEYGIIPFPELEISYHCKEDHARIDFSNPVEALSSALYHGGRQTISHVLNMKVTHNIADDYKGYESPHTTLENKARKLGLSPDFAGLMTSASMKSFRFYSETEGDLGVFCCLTAGLTNARAPGDRADYRDLEAHRAGLGTINIIAGTNARLSEAALCEALMMVTDARSWAVTNCGVKSRISGEPASGTGTDSHLVFSGTGPEIHFCGKHTLLGEMLARAVITPLQEVIKLIQHMEKLKII
ncbi:adenosylcobinamide amidohydrolase [Oceanispirochaeta sp.]|jgi:adenosylcobinamide amidohydrolase|uniref:adenosylcobinamide amidohydrolase n=1 Tax=Oceanispirochaeta sp. TaxID=2035350 RepID=UPI00261256E3|nr:adenosylcobinamide amidohydrolase [Oceanispirochaeta sp.]MDA3957060.1 adenosylcobinamide amidohydrolase [Oceanispirochaeta sp.]